MTGVTASALKDALPPAETRSMALPNNPPGFEIKITGLGRRQFPPRVLSRTNTSAAIDGGNKSTLMRDPH